MVTTTLIAAVPAPAGYVVDFANPQRHGDVAGYWVFSVGLVLSFSFLAMRVYTKVFVARSFAIEDCEFNDALFAYSSLSSLTNIFHLVCMILAWVSKMVPFDVRRTNKGNIRYLALPYRVF
jgi:hypothetical protein